jgi:hypothetical protein
MTRTLLSALLFALVLAGCSGKESGADGSSSGEIAKAATIAYGFTYRFALPGAAVGQAQDRHIALCDQLGPARCRMLEMHRSAGASNTGGSLRFAVAAGDARRFGSALAAPVVRLGGELTARDFEAEDVSGQQAEAQAKVAEKNDVANRSALSSVRDRIALSTIWIYYDGKTGFGEQIGDAFAAGGETLTSSVVALIYFLAAAVPWVVVLGLMFLVARAISRRLRRTRPDRHAVDAGV